MGGFAWVTLATNDSYSLGALVLAHSLKQAGTSHSLVVLITPGVTNAMREKLSAVFNVVQEVNILDSKDESNLRLLKRPELGITFTKLHCWRLTQFDKCVFLDADTLVLQNCDELFEREELSAAPDVGWPDCFNSGVFVYRPSNETYEKLIEFALEKGSFDGGDQGLLNLYFSDWATKDISKHLPFIYNLSSTATYSYLPAFKQFGTNAKIIHFIGATKPWLQYFNTETRKVQPNQDLKHLEGILQHWWNIFCALIHPNLSPEMAGLAGAFAQLTLGAARTAEQSALDDHLRRQGWETGNIDYMGRDSFDNIWSKICQTLSAALPTEEPKPIEATTPPTSDTRLAEVKEAVSEQEGSKSEPIAVTTETKSVSEAKPSAEEVKAPSEPQSGAIVETPETKPVSEAKPSAEEAKAPSEAQSGAIIETPETKSVYEAKPSTEPQSSAPDQVVISQSEAPAPKTEVPQCPIQIKPKEETRQDVASPTQETLAQLPTETAAVDVCTKPSKPVQVVPQTTEPASDISAQLPSEPQSEVSPATAPTAVSQQPPSATTQPPPPVSPTTPDLPSPKPSAETPSVPPETVPTQPPAVTPAAPAETTPVAAEIPSVTPTVVSAPPQPPTETLPAPATPPIVSTPTQPPTETTPLPAPETPAPTTPPVVSAPPQPPTATPPVVSAPPQPPTETPPAPATSPVVSAPPQPSTGTTPAPATPPVVSAPPQPPTVTTPSPAPETPTPATPPVVAATPPAKTQPAKSESTSASASPGEQSKKSSDAKPEAPAASSVPSPTPPPRKTGGGKKSKSKK